MVDTLNETAAIILDYREYGESDKIITLYTFDNGKVAGIAKGASKSKNRFLNKFEIFSYVTVGYKEKQQSTLLFIQEAELHESFIHLRTDLHKYICANFIREFLIIATIERVADEDIFHLLRWSFSALNDDKDCFAISAIFLLRLFDYLGYCPEISCCHHCRRDFSTATRYSFNQSGGGLICNQCSAEAHTQYTSISMGTLRILRLALSEPMERLHRLHFSKRDAEQSLTILAKYGRDLFQREVQSWKAVREILG